MPEAADLRYEVINEGDSGDTILHVYLPDGVAASDVELINGINTDVAEVNLEDKETGHPIGTAKVAGYQVEPESQVRFSKKHRRYSIRLLPAILAAVATPVADSAPPKSPPPPPATTSPLPAPPAPASPPPGPTGNMYDLLENDDVADDVEVEGGSDEGAGAAKKKKKKKKKSKKIAEGAEANGEPTTAPTANGGPHDRVSSGDENDQSGVTSAAPAAAAEGEGGATGAAKKKKKKKKKAGAGATGATVVENAGAEGEEEVAEEEGTEASAQPTEQTATAPAAATAAAYVSTTNDSPTLAAKSNGSRSIAVDMQADFGEEPYGSFKVAAAVQHDPLLGPAVQHGLGKVQVKGEDKWLEAPANSWCLTGLEDSATPVSAFGIFDGHGGRMAAQHAAKQLLPLVGRFAERAVGPTPATSDSELAEQGYLGPKEESAGEAEAVERARVAEAQDALIGRLPKALHAGFVRCDEEVVSRFKESGCTATLAVQVGWELLVANVGDSLAYLDTGSEIVQMSANHRVAESPEEQQRVIAAGGRIKPAKYGEDDEAPTPSDGSPGGTEGQHLRVWPSGINMTRTIGDLSSNGLLIAEPAVRQISLPVAGARLIIASDGLWDAVNAKTIIGQLRTCNAREAASRAAVYAMRHKKHDDDVTVVVADFVPRATDSHVPGLLKRPSGPAAAALAALAAAGMREEKAAQAWRPLETHSDSWRERHRTHRARAAAYLSNLAEAEAAEAAAAEQLERQRRLAVAPAAGTAGVGTAVRPPPVSDTYRELAELTLSMDAIISMEAEPEPTLATEAGDDWKPVEAKKKREGTIDVRRELLRAAKPAPAGGAVSGAVGGGPRPEGGRRERPPRRDRAAGYAVSGGSGAVEGKEAGGGGNHVQAAQEVAEGEGVMGEGGVGMQEGPGQQQRRGGERRGERRGGERRGERRERGGRGGPRGGGGDLSGAAADATAAVDASGAPAAVAAAAPAAAAAAAPGVVKSGSLLYVPRSLLTGGAGAMASGPPASATSANPVASGGGGVSTEAAGDASSAAAAEGSSGYGRPRRDATRSSRGGVRNRREGGPPPTSAGSGAEAAPAAVADGVETATANGSAGSRRAPYERRTRKEPTSGASKAATAALGGLPAAAPAATRLPVASTTDPVVHMDTATSRRTQPPPYSNGNHASRAPPHTAAAAAHTSHQPATAPPPQQPQTSAVQPTSTSSGRLPVPRGPSTTQPAAAGAPYPSQQPSAVPRVGPQHSQHPQEPPHRTQAPSAAAVAPGPGVPTYAGPMDFGAGFGPAAGTWAPANGGSAAPYGGGSQPAPAAGGAGAQRPPVAVPGSPGGSRSVQDITAVAAAAAAAVVARKGPAGGRSGLAGGQGHGGGQYGPSSRGV